MNKETRTFIWGIILLFSGGFTLAIHVDAFVHHSFKGGFHWVLLGCSLIGCIGGGIKILKTTD